jgi:Tol biopolymer transport system component/DNA-binding winged helix-turn-helix (wHTH) protein
MTLVSKPGELITREELQREVWGRDTTIDFERGISSAINKVREALGDSAESPRYVETLAKRGYRFIAPVRLESAPSQGLEPEQSGESTPLLNPPEISAPIATFAVEKTAVATSVFPAAENVAETAPLSIDKTVARRSRTLLWTAALLGVVAASSFSTYFIVGRSEVFRPARVQQLTQLNALYSGPPNIENFLSLVSDGPRIYTSVLSNGRAHVASIDLTGKYVQPLPLPDELSSASIADISRDGSKLIVRSLRSRESEQPLWIVPTTGSSAWRVGEVLAHDATWMPAGDSVLYASENELGVVELKTGKIANFAHVPGRAFWPRWSPDGSTLRFTLLDPVRHITTLWQVDRSGAGLRQLKFPEIAGMSICCGSWTADASSYVFQASNSQESNIWAVGTGVRPRLTELTNGPLRYMSPLPAREDRSVFLVGLEQSASTQVFDQRRQQFTPAPSFLAHAGRVTYSRDGNWVAWTDTSGQLWRARSDGSGVLRLTDDDLEVFLAHWSPDGQQLLLMGRGPGETWQIYTVGATGGAAHKIFADQRNVADPDWSADGKQIVFGREDDLMGKENGPRDIEIYDLATGRIRTLPGSDGLFSPRWSPDGHWIVALSLDQTRLLLYDVQRESWKTLFTGTAADPVWAADSRAVYFHAFGAPESAILRLELNGVTHSVADLSKLGMLTTGDYFFSGITPGGAPIVEPHIGTGNLYSVSLPTLQ